MFRESFEIFDLFSSEFEDRKQEIEKGDFKMKTFNEATFLRNRPEWEKELFREISHFLLYEIQKGVEVHFLETYTRYSHNNLMFCRMITTLEALKIFLKLKYEEIENPQKWVRDYAKISRQTWVEITIREGDLIEKTILLDNVFDLLKQAFNRVVKFPRLSKVSVGKPKKKLPGFVTPAKMKLDIEISTDGFCQVGIRIYKSQLGELLQKLIE